MQSPRKVRQQVQEYVLPNEVSSTLITFSWVSLYFKVISRHEIYKIRLSGESDVGYMSLMAQSIVLQSYQAIKRKVIMKSC